MSMLAEQRRKQKWTLNPRGKQWSDDPNKFGQKMLEKMGWTSGKGLGANEQGMTKHVRVSLKNDTSGIGFKNNNLDKAWTEHQDGFNSFLQQLQNSQDDNIVQVEVKTESGEKSLELKSKQSRARVHYHKFTRGKDVKRYSSKDLANIFGQKELNGSENTNENGNNQENFDSDPLGKQENRGGVITIYGGNMAEYFSKKSQNISLTPKRKMRQGSTSESEPEYAGFGFASTPTQSSNDAKENKETEGSCNYAFENPCLRVNSPENISNTNTELKSSNKRKISDDYELSINDNCKDLKNHIKDGYKNAFVNPALNLEPTNDEVYNGKEFEVSRMQFGVANSALDLQDEVVNKKRVTFNDHVEYSTDCVKKKKKKKEKVMLDKFEVENKKSKKKKKQDNVNSSASSGIINEALDVEEVAEEINDNEINERKSSRPKKRKSNHRLSLQTIVEIPEEDKEADDHEIITKRLKVDENVNDDDLSQKNFSNKKGRKKKKKKEKAEEKMKTVDEDNKIENVEEKDNRETKAEFCEEVDDTPKEQDQENLKVKEKKKKKKGSERNNEIDESMNDDGIETNIAECTEQETIKTEETVKINKKKKTKDVDKSDINVDVDIKSKKEISDKENKNHNFVNISKEEKPKKEKHKESVISEESTHTMESVNVECAEPTENTSIAWRYNKFYRYKTPTSWKPKAITSKNILTSLLHRNSVAHFPGANVDEIKGYGSNI
nr:G patch domain-containing protein 4-like [Megalopta genalis]XP_033328708.1 G patch domain-containing protein 4-like [Megalopta genalis]